jgi:hypothetical protein
VLAHVTSDDDYRVLFPCHGLQASAETVSSFELGEDEALVNSWTPPPALPDHLSNVTTNPHAICAATVHLNETGDGVAKLHAAVLGFTSIERTQYKIHILASPDNPAISGTSTGKPIVLGSSDAKDLPSDYDDSAFTASDFRCLCYTGNAATGANRVYSLWHKDGGKVRCFDESVHTITLSSGTMTAGGV